MAPLPSSRPSCADRGLRRARTSVRRVEAGALAAAFSALAIAACSSGTTGTDSSATATSAPIGSATSARSASSATAPPATTAATSGPSGSPAPPVGTSTAPGGASSTSVTTTVGSGDVTCVAADLGLRLSYPAGWFTPTDPRWHCKLFDPASFTVPEQSEVPHVAVVVFGMEGTMAAEVEKIRAAPFDTVDADEPTTLGGRDAVCLTLRSSGEALLEKDTRTYLCIVDFAGRAIGFENIRAPGRPDVGNDAEVRRMAQRAALAS